MRLHEPKDEDVAAAPAQASDDVDKSQLFGSTLQKKKPKNADRNRALEQAKDHFSKALELDAEYIKPLYQRMTIWREEEEFEEAVKDAKRIEEIDPGFKGIRPLIMQLEKQRDEKFAKMKDEVMGGLKQLGNMFLGNFGMSVDNFKMNQNADGTYNMQYGNNE